MTQSVSTVLWYSLIGGAFSLVGGMALLWKPKFTNRFIIPLVSFGAGAFMSAALLDILPEAVESVSEPHPVFMAALAGFLLFFAVERFVMKYLRTHDHDGKHSDHTESLPYLLIAGDSFHNFIDGIVIGLAYVANPALGLPTALAIAAHEVPQEIGDFAVFIKLGWKRSTIMAINILQSLLTIPGVLLGFSAGTHLETYLPYLLALAAGIFIYIAASDLIPEIHHKSGHTQFWPVVAPMIAGALVLYYLSVFAHGA